MKAKTKDLPIKNLCIQFNKLKKVFIQNKFAQFSKLIYYLNNIKNVCQVMI